MAANTKVFQDMADAMLPLFDDMPQVVVLVKDHEVFLQEPYPLAVYMSPDILINPSHARACSFDDIQGTICHELIHAWLHRKGLDGTGEFLDDHHNEWFVRKALEINEKKIDNLNVKLDFLLTTRKGVDTYSRIAGIRFAPHVQHEIRQTTKSVAAITRELVEMLPLSRLDRFSKLAIVGFLAVVTSFVVNKAHLIPDGVASYVWCAWAIMSVVFALLSIIHRTR